MMCSQPAGSTHMGAVAFTDSVTRSCPETYSRAYSYSVFSCWKNANFLSFYRIIVIESYLGDGKACLWVCLWGCFQELTLGGRPSLNIGSRPIRLGWGLYEIKKRVAVVQTVPFLIPGPPRCEQVTTYPHLSPWNHLLPYLPPHDGLYPFKLRAKRNASSLK